MDNPKQGRILIVDDDEGVAYSMVKILEKLNLHTVVSYNLKDAFQKLETNDFHLVFLDVNLPDGNGVEAIKEIVACASSPQVIIMTAYSDPDGAQYAIESGAWDYLQKPASPKDIRLQTLRALQYQEQKIKAAQNNLFEAPNIIAQSHVMRQCISHAAQITNSDANVLITGDTGTGKELFAKAIHNNSARRNGEFIVVDCSVLSENLIESVLFGHEKGAFTGADRKRKGLVLLANGGSLFLDEVAELPEMIQSSFLRVLQEKKFRPVGSEKEIYSDFRVICATNKNLDQMVSDKLFRADLLFRLKNFVLHLPALVTRKGDIPLIALDQIKKSCKTHKTSEKNVSPDFMNALEQYNWPGNVRELINVVETSVTSALFEDTLHPFHLPAKLRALIVRSKISTLQTPQKPEEQPAESNIFIQAESLPHTDFMNEAEKKYLEFFYSDSHGDIQRLLERTGLSRTVLYRKLKKHNISA
ncbi:sigma-54 dependent transcriptional regulator [uncultured Desulfobacter sp.]|uniref:sigma-54-dependent transcriptional regulator n=1 Tax=uncultured Desulfobacter sp. TaxID=240139 RepID=UPI002AAB9DB7|nr:sigma-54 dependent transcriptional regulator [uncultured Desulfobacter sp.]